MILMTDIKKLREKVKYNKNLTTYTEDELKYVQTVTGKALFNHDEENEQPKQKTHWSDRVKCDICGKEFTRSSRTAHNKTLYHNMKKQEHDKLKKILID